MISSYFELNLNDLKLKQTVTLWPCLGSTKLVVLNVFGWLCLQCGAEAHSHYVDSELSWASACLRDQQNL